MPASFDDLLRAADEHHRAGRMADARQLAQQAFQLAPTDGRAMLLLGILSRAMNQPAEAIDWLTRAAIAEPANAEPRFSLGLLYQQQRDLERAAEHYRAALERQPSHAKAASNLGRVLLDRGEIPIAIELLKQLVERHPRHLSAHINLGDALRRNGELPAALSSFQRATDVDPSSGPAWSTLGLARMEVGDLNGGLTALRQAVALEPRLKMARYNLGRDLAQIGGYDESVIQTRAAIELQPDDADAWSLLGNTLMMIGDVPGGISAQQHAAQLRPHDAFASNLLLNLHYLPNFPAAELRQAHEQWARQNADPLGNITAALPNRRDPDRALRIGFVSPDFRAHPVAIFFEPLLKMLDRSSLELYCYSNTARPDETTLRIRDGCDHWRDISRMNDVDAAALVRRDAIDVLVDLAGHTGDHRLGIFARRTAPVQMTWLGYPGTTGMAAIDYRLTDDVADPKDLADQWYTEPLIRLAGGAWAYQPSQPPPAPAARPADGATFASFNHLPKISPQVLATWARILHSVSDSRLLLKARGLLSQTARATVRRQLEQNGIAADRIELLPWTTDIASHLALYHRVDIALDPFPYNGTTTTCEALWMGVPVITLAGNGPAGRVGASLLHHAGLDQFVARNLEQYVALAVTTAADLTKLRAQRQTLQKRVQASALGDPGRLADEMERAFRQAWRVWLARNK